MKSHFIECGRGSPAFANWLIFKTCITFDLVGILDGGFSISFISYHCRLNQEEFHFFFENSQDL